MAQNLVLNMSKLQSVTSKNLDISAIIFSLFFFSANLNVHGIHLGTREIKIYNIIFIIISAQKINLTHKRNE
jgi:hypothetical protein